MKHSPARQTYKYFWLIGYRILYWTGSKLYLWNVKFYEYFRTCSFVSLIVPIYKYYNIDIIYKSTIYYKTKQEKKFPPYICVLRVNREPPGAPAAPLYFAAYQHSSTPKVSFPFILAAAVPYFS